MFRHVILSDSEEAVAPLVKAVHVSFFAVAQNDMLSPMQVLILLFYNCPCPGSL
jgi:hypothetical protein